MSYRTACQKSERLHSPLIQTAVTLNFLLSFRFLPVSHIICQLPCIITHNQYLNHQFHHYLYHSIHKHFPLVRYGTLEYYTVYDTIDTITRCCKKWQKALKSHELFENLVINGNSFASLIYAGDKLFEQKWRWHVTPGKVWKCRYLKSHMNIQATVAEYQGNTKTQNEWWKALNCKRIWISTNIKL